MQNAVGNTGNVGTTAAVNTKGNTNQNNNQSFNSNAISQGQGLSVGIGSISFPSGGGGAGAAGAGGAATPAAAGDPAGGAGATPASYSGEVQFASPNQAITFGNSQVTNISTNLPQLPGIPGSPGNFSQPYKPDVFINGAGPVRPGKLTWDQAKDCRGGWGFKDNFVGGSRGRVNEITLVYAAWDKITIVNDIANYVGISSVEGADRPWLPAVCEAAFHAMSKGVNYGIVEFIVRPKNTMKGFGVGSSAGGSGTPSVMTTGPYALAGALGFGMGWSSQRVEGEVMIQITGLRLAQIPTSEAPTEQPVAEKQQPAAGAAQPNAAQPGAGTAPAQPAAATSAPQPAAGTPAAGTAQPTQPTTGTTAGPTTGTTAQPAATPSTTASPLEETTKFIKTNGTPLPLRIPSGSTQ